MELQGKVAVVTGAASGIGLALSERFLAEGMSVVMADVEAPVLEAQGARLAAAHPGKVLVERCDVSDAAQVRGLKEAANEAFGTVQLLCNNAGVAAGRATWKTRPEVWDWEVGVNLLGVGYGVSTFVPDMVAAGEGHVVNTASEAGLHAAFGLGVYHATKYGVVGLSEALRTEMTGTGVGVTCVCPELVDTLVFESTRNAPGPPRPAGAGPHPDGEPRGDDGHEGHATRRGRRAGGRGRGRGPLLGAHPRRHRARGCRPATTPSKRRSALTPGAPS